MLQVEYLDNDTIRILSHDGMMEEISWTIDEWVQDPTIVPSIVNAVVTALTDPVKFLLIHDPGRTSLALAKRQYVARLEQHKAAMKLLGGIKEPSWHKEVAGALISILQSKMKGTRFIEGAPLYPDLRMQVNATRVGFDGDLYVSTFYLVPGSHEVGEIMFMGHQDDEPLVVRDIQILADFIYNNFRKVEEVKDKENNNG